MTQNIEHLLDAYLISVSLLWSRVCQGILLIFNQVVLLLLNFKSALYILWITAIYKHFFFQFVSCLFILLTVFYRVETVSLSRVQFIIIYFTDHILVSSLKRHCPMQGHLGFPIFFLEVLYFCLLHVGLWSIFHSFLWVGAKSIFRFAFFFFCMWMSS